MPTAKPSTRSVPQLSDLCLFFGIVARATATTTRNTSILKFSRGKRMTNQANNQPSRWACGTTLAMPHRCKRCAPCYAPPLLGVSRISTWPTNTVHPQAAPQPILTSTFEATSNPSAKVWPGPCSLDVARCAGEVGPHWHQPTGANHRTGWRPG